MKKYIVLMVLVFLVGGSVFAFTRYSSSLAIDATEVNISRSAEQVSYPSEPSRTIPYSNSAKYVTNAGAPPLRSSFADSTPRLANHVAGANFTANPVQDKFVDQVIPRPAKSTPLPAFQSTSFAMPVVQETPFEQNTQPGPTGQQFGTLSSPPKQFQPVAQPAVVNLATNRNFSAPARRVASVAGLPPVAMNVKKLVRAQYRLPKSAAETLETLFGMEGNENVETTIHSEENSALVRLQITTDEDTQRAIGTFLNKVYSVERVRRLETKSEGEPTNSEKKDVVSDIE